MRVSLPILGLTLAAAACSDSTVAPRTPTAGPSAARAVIQDTLAHSQTSRNPAPTVTISGPTYVPLYQSNQYVATASGGNGPPYTFLWRGRQYQNGYGWGSYQNYYSTGSNTNYFAFTSCSIAETELNVSVTDSYGVTGNNSIYIYLSNPC